MRALLWSPAHTPPRGRGRGSDLRWKFSSIFWWWIYDIPLEKKGLFSKSMVLLNKLLYKFH